MTTVKQTITAMRPIRFAAVMLLTLTVTASAAETNQLLPPSGYAKVTPAQPGFAGMELDFLGYPTNAAVALTQGRADARRDLTNGVLSMKTCGLPREEAWEYKKLLDERCHVSLDPLAGCCVTEGLIKYIDGYNGISEAYIEQKYGTNIFDQLWSEAKTNKQKFINAPASGSRTYTIREGDTLTKIASQQGITLKQLEDANPGVEPTKLQIGQKLVLPAAGKKTGAKPPQAAN